VIIRSSDNVEFRVFKTFLRAASPVFETMFALPQPEETDSSKIDDTKDGLPVIPMTEPSGVVERMLMFIYPSWGAQPGMTTFEGVQSMLEVARKYDIEVIRNHIRRMMMEPRFFKDELGYLRVFGIAFEYRLKEVALNAMRQARKYPALGHPYVKELDSISPKAYHQLLDYHWRCSTAAVRLTTTFDWVTSMWGANTHIPECNQCSVSIIARRGGGGGVSPSKYWTIYMERARIALRDRPCSASVLKADLIDNAKQDAKKCVHCYTSSGVAMWQFTEVFAQEIEKVTSAIEPELDL